MLWFNWILLKVAFGLDCLADVGSNKVKNEVSDEHWVWR